MRKTLPAFYYLSHFLEFLSFFKGKNKALLPEPVTHFIDDFHSCEKQIQAMWVRIANRKHSLIEVKTLQHEEIAQPSDCLRVLKTMGYVGSLNDAPKEQVVSVLTKQKLFALLRRLDLPLPPASINKPSLNEYVLSRIATLSTLPTNLEFDYVFRKFDYELKFLLFVYFGHTRGRLDKFSMRDLGVMRTRNDAVTGEAKFDDCADAEAAFALATANDALSVCSDLPSLESLPVVTSLEGKRIKSRYLLNLGKQFLVQERSLALSALALSDCDEATEKWLRETYKDGEREQVETALLAIIDAPASEYLLTFAEDFYARKYLKKRTSILTDILRNATRQLELDSQYTQAAEQGVVDWYQRHGTTAVHTENSLWRSLFGLTFWSILYADNHASLSNEFDRQPQLLRHNCFYQQCQDEIEHLLSQFKSTTQLMAHVLKTATEHYGKVNSLFIWHAALLDPIKLFLQHAGIEPVVKLLQAMCQDYSQLRDGFPDLMVIHNNQLRFEEIKAPGDSLRRNQLVSLNALQRCGFAVSVTQVSWVRDPEQPYVVVDIETTGGGAEYHRITEVGMVKVIAGEVVDSWQSLINPQRKIPLAITRLTGIDNQMVADAPLFEALATQISEFTQGSIFVAHNVRFDYGFIKQEFARLGLTFKRPKLCTVQLMRRQYPGLKRYSLAALTEHFSIDMTRHHRALSDAQAAAELLKLGLTRETES